ncbi:hypothetical protein EYF80_054320 [Liparis tanakae]|uniref:Uncharacterized protein n=1 Tax=Liparis tanakae TaxID=230148 RepID=A0A4Z2F3P2_9TELE|nr:hypothetical protein EYF80_054320 [Liparis tanakae]
MAPHLVHLPQSWLHLRGQDGFLSHGGQRHRDEAVVNHQGRGQNSHGGCLRYSALWRLHRQLHVASRFRVEEGFCLDLKRHIHKEVLPGVRILQELTLRQRKGLRDDGVLDTRLARKLAAVARLPGEGWRWRWRGRGRWSGRVRINTVTPSVRVVSARLVSGSSSLLQLVHDGPLDALGPRVEPLVARRIGAEPALRSPPQVPVGALRSGEGPVRRGFVHGNVADDPLAAVVPLLWPFPSAAAAALPLRCDSVGQRLLGTAVAPHHVVALPSSLVTHVRTVAMVVSPVGASSLVG